ncbi:MAG: Cytoskeleton protein RodZ [Paracidovorax wautersii]|uniref:Cytoskeleton protein RodZ n=1 Tax=Paracidovorax wautersii TaxID=1177982 RepID=A0A7V8JRH5_9BURK|nr:MAG: Cytoskeleton protein RodZ [Paracidovorax wautersii]
MTMTGERVPSQETVTAPAQGQGGGALTAGQTLRQARERAGLHLASLAAVLKVPPQRLEALEADDYDRLPGMAFVRGLASAMSRSLKLDAEQVLALLPKTEASALRQDRVVASVARHPVLPSHSASYGYGGRSKFARVLAVLAVVLLVGAVAIVFLPQIRDAAGLNAADAQPAAADAPAEVATSDAAAVSAANAAAGSSDSTLALTSLTPAAPASTPAPAPAPLPTPAATSVAAAQPALQAGGAPAGGANLPTQGVLATPTTGTVVFSAQGESWVEVLDANRLPLLRRTLQAGEKVGVSGAEPLSVTVGHVQNVAVEVRGQAFGLDSYKRGNVARFQVK